MSLTVICRCPLRECRVCRKSATTKHYTNAKNNPPVRTWPGEIFSPVTCRIVYAGDGRKTRGIIAQVVFSILTLGIYNLIWLYGAGDRIFFNCAKRNIPNTTSGGSVLLWYVLGAFILVGPFVGLYQLISGLNQLYIDYNRNHDNKIAPI